MAVALYARVSTPRQAEKDLSIPDQLRQLREYCKAHNLPIAAEYIEPGASATDDRRPVFQQMIADAGQDPRPMKRSSCIAARVSFAICSSFSVTSGGSSVPAYG